jgi:chromosomal replication initiator protein
LAVFNVWDGALAYIRDNMTEMSYKTWVNDVIKPISLKDGELVLQVPQEIHMNMLKKRYLSLLEDAVRETSGQHVTICFTLPVSDEEKAQQPLPRAGTPLPTLNPKYTFETFVIGNSNRFAHAASLAVAEAPSEAYNPLFLYGGVGLGKTHLMHAIGHFIRRQDPMAQIVYVTSEKFTNDLITAIQTATTVQFREQYRNADVLLVDDIQFIANKESTQEEFFHTFNTLHEANKQIIISSDKPPKEIPTLEERLRSRFEWGLVADIQRPDFETRVAILRKRALTENMEVGDDVLQFIANHVESNIRELEGSLTRVMAYASLVKRLPDLSLVEEALRDYFPKKGKHEINIPFIQQVVGEHYNIPLEAFKAKKKPQEIAFPRQIAMYLARELTDLPLKSIGREFGGKDHSTVIHACKTISAMIEKNADFKSTVNDLVSRIRE